MKSPTAKRLPSGKWRVQTTVYGRRISVTRDTKTEAENDAMILKFRQSDAPSIRKKIAKNLTLYKAMDLYLADTTEALSPSTVKSYRSIQKYRFKSVRDMPLASDINWQQVINEEKKCHVIKIYKGREIETNKLLSPKTIHNAWGFVETVLNYFKLPVPEVKLPQKIKTEHEFLDPDDIQVFLKAIEGHRYELPYLLCLHGLRRSEMAAVTKSDIIIPKNSKKKPYIRIRGAVVYDEHNKLVEKDENKTEDSRREVPVFIPRLLTLVEDMPEGRLFTASPNNLLHPLNVVLRNNGLPECGLHGLRHSFASLLVHFSAPDRVIQKWGGWSDATILKAVYTHLIRKDEEESFQKVEAFYTDPD